MRVSPLCVLPALGALVAFPACCGHHCHAAAASDTYAIVASKAVMDDPAWKAATVDALAAKHPGARVIVWDKAVEEAREALAAAQPSFTAFAVKPGQAGVRFTIAVSNLCRALDGDPYVDTFWGIVTGYDVASAEALAKAGPIAIERALDCAGCDLTAFKQAWRYSEDHRGTMNLWQRGVTDKVQDVPCDTDNTQGVLERLQKDRVQFMTTSGHATQHDWQMGYCGPNMALVHKDGRLVARDTKKADHPAGSTEPKVYFGTGNCLIGDIDKPDCMALAWIKDGAARLARDIERVGVFVNDDIFRIARLVNDGIIDVVQLHGDEDGEYIGRLKALCPATVIKCVAVRGNDPVIYPDECDIVLLDAYSPSARGGTGRKVCWREYREVKKPVILAGGITPENVKRALAAVKPWGVDSSGGLETDGKKDARKVAQYISEIRECN